VGVNCGRTLEENLVAATAMRRAMPEATLVAKPNAGLPRMEDTIEAVYDVTPEVMAEYALKFGAVGIKALGGCCGSTPAHISAMKAALQGFEPPALDELLAETTPIGANGDTPGRRERSNARRRERV
jgi:methionine synthase I (cobalamin-dependent)